MFTSNGTNANPTILCVTEDDDGFHVDERNNENIAPRSTYPSREAAAARVLQLLGIKCAILPQRHPETVCIGFVETKD